MVLEKVYERKDDFDERFGLSGYEKVGLKVDDRVIWFACMYYPSNDKEQITYYHNAEKQINNIIKFQRFAEGFKNCINIIDFDGKKFLAVNRSDVINFIANNTDVIYGKYVSFTSVGLE